MDTQTDGAGAGLRSGVTRMAQMANVQMTIRVLMGLAIGVIILNELFTISIINNTTGPFAGTITTIENIGGAALTLLVLGVLVLAGAVAMRYMDRF